MIKRKLASVQLGLKFSANTERESVHFPPARSNLESLLASLTFFLWNLLLFLRGNLLNFIPIINIPSQSSAEEIRKAWGLGDAGSLLEVAITWSKFHQLDPQSQNWIPGFWTLGMSALEVPLIWMERIGIPIFFSLLLINLFLWTSIVFLVWKYYSPRVGRVLLLFGILILRLSWDFDYMMRDYVFYTESVAYGLLFTGLLLFSLRFYYPHLRSGKCLVLAGILVGLSLMFRHTSDSGLWLLLVLSALLYLRRFKNRKFLNNTRQMTKRKKYTKKKSKELLESEYSKQKSLELLFFSAIAVLTTMPWRLLRSIAFSHFTLSLSGASVYVPRILWTTPESPNGQSYGWNGGNWACLIDRITCLEMQGDLENTSKSNYLLLNAIKTALKNPIDFAQIRIEFLIRNWIPGFHWLDSFDSLVATFFLFLPIVLGVTMFKLRNSLKLIAIAPWACFILMHSAQLLVTHFESRYFISLRILFVGMFLNILMCRNSKSRDSQKILQFE